MKQIEKAIKLMRQSESNVWIDLTTGEILNFYQRLGRKNVMVLRPSETDETLRNVWLRNNEVYEWIPFHKVYGGFKIYTTKYDNKYFVKIYSPDKSYEVYHVRSLDDATVEKLVKNSL